MYKVIFRNKSFGFILPIFILFSVLAGFRPTKDFTIDTPSYVNYFEAFSKFSYNDVNLSTELIEPGFVILTYLISRLTNNYHIYLSIIFIIFNFSLFLFWQKLINFLKISNPEIFLIIVIGFTLSSNWYNNFSYNGLRQGLAAPILYLSILYIFEKKYIKSVFLLLLALSFHKSIIFVIIFFPILFFNNKNTFITYILLGFIFLFNLSELLVFNISQYLKIPLYSLISEYGGEDSLYKGFSITFFLYSFILLLIILFINFYYKKFYSLTNILHIEILFKMYTVLIAPYFLLGFGGFSNRYALYGWFFIPIIYSFNLHNIKMLNRDKIIIVLLVFFFSIYKNLVIYF